MIGGAAGHSGGLQVLRLARCDQCGSPHSSVETSKPLTATLQLQYRVCLDCEHRYQTLQERRDASSRPQPEAGEEGDAQPPGPGEEH